MTEKMIKDRDDEIARLKVDKDASLKGKTASDKLLKEASRAHEKACIVIKD